MVSNGKYQITNGKSELKTHRLRVTNPEPETRTRDYGALQNNVGFRQTYAVFVSGG
jgi:hypothetical protein